MKKMSLVLVVLLFMLISEGNTFAHFGMLIPSDSMVMQSDNREIVLNVSFSHPFEMVGMETVSYTHLTLPTTPYV